MVDVANVEEAPKPAGRNFDWTYKMAGMKFKGSSVATETVENERSVVGQRERDS